ncbi:MAG: SDR family oxidoreductase [Candidatus Eisenbacteria bacterium]|nr:SDR family oxidoreductase [Candidatus Eisenbacteria bacterium]MBU1948908.1 SDR family oxidoreductase [Candidatus Eisenbacteria bacterium]
MPWSLEGRAAVCLAASKGLGLGIAREMAAAGARILLVSRRREPLESAAALIVKDLESGAAYPGVTVWHRPELIAADLMEEEAAPSIVAQAKKHFGRLDILVNNIGGPPAGLFHQHSMERWEESYHRLFGSVVRQIKAAHPLLQKSDAPRVLTVTSVAARQPIEGLVLSNTFRPGLVGLVKTLAQEWGPDGILINNLAPGMFATERIAEVEEATAKQRGISREAVRQERLASIPLGRFGDPRELGRVAVFLASPANSYITGQTILVDGGFYKGL